MINLVSKAVEELSKTGTKSISHHLYGTKRIEDVAKVGIDVAFPSLFPEEEIEELNRKQIKELTLKVIEGVNRKSDRDKKEPREITDAREEMLKRYDLYIGHDNGQYGVFDLVKRRVSPLHYNNILVKFPKDKDRREFQAMARTAKFSFNPKVLDPSWNKEEEGLRITVFNTCKPQLWREKYPIPLPQWKGEPPKQFTALLSHLIPHKQDQTMFLDWFHWALVDRHQNFLHLREARGNGKTLLTRPVAAVIGYFHETRDGVDKDGFNAEFRNKRIIIIDDDSFIGTSKGNDRRKKLINTTQTFNEKFQPVTNSESQHASFIICSNPTSPFYMDWEERRMIMPNLNPAPLLGSGVLTKGEISFLDAMLKPEEEMTNKDLMWQAKLGHFMLNWVPSTHNNAQWKKGTFWNDVVRSLPNFIEEIVREILSKSKDSIDFWEIHDGFNDRKTSSEKAFSVERTKSYLKDFTYKGKCLVDRFEGTDNNLKIIPIPEYTKSYEEGDI